MPDKSNFEALKESESKYRMLIEQASDGIFQASIEGRLTDVNRIGCSMLGYSRDEVLGLNISDVVEVGDPQVAKANKAVLASGKMVSAEHVIYRKDGSTFLAEINSKLLPNGVYQGIMRDITERKRMEEALRKSEAKNRALVEAIPDLMVQVSEDGTIVDFESQKGDMLPMPPARFIGKSLRNVLPPQLHRLTMQAVGQTLQSGTMQILEYRMPVQNIEQYFEARLVPSGQSEVLIIIRDISDRKRAQEELTRAKHELELRVIERTQLLQESEARYRAVVEDQTEIISRFLPDGTLTFVNEAHCQYWGRTREELIGASFLDFMLPEERAHVEKHLLTFSMDNPISTNEQRVVSPDGSIRWLHWTERALFDEQGNIREFQTVGSDVTERERAKQEAEAANRAKSEFLSRMSHELRTPLNAIIGFSQLLQTDELEPDQLESVSLIHRAGRHLLDLINEVLDISRIEAGHLSLSTEPVSVSGVLRECLDLVRTITADKDLILDASEALLGSWHVQADRQRLKQILLNLLSNAIKYNRVGGSVTLSCAEPTPGQVRISVSDTGAGIPKGRVEKLFTPFERLDAHRTGVEGTGLGLALSKSLAELMGGVTGVESTVGQGSTFWVELPIAGPLDQTVAEPLPAPAPADAHPAGRTVLYIEDNVSNVRLVERILEKLPDVTLISAMQGGVGFALACEHNPDLILLDLHLPDVHGEQVLQWLRQNSGTKDTTVVIISADATPREVVRLLDLGANSYITKPFDVKRFITVVRDALDGKELANVR